MTRSTTVGLGALAALAGALFAAGEKPPANGREFFERASRRYDASDYAGSVADYSRSIELDARVSNAWTNRAQARLYLGEVAAAIADFEHAMKIDPKSYLHVLGRGQGRIHLGDWAGAIADFDRSLALKPSKNHLGLIHLERYLAKELAGDSAGAAADWAEGSKLIPDAANHFPPPGSLRGAFKFGAVDRALSGESGPRLWLVDILEDANGQRRAGHVAVRDDGRRVTTLEGAVAPEWSPSGREFAFFTRHRQIDVLWLGDRGGRMRAINVQRRTRAVLWQIAWSPDATRVAYAFSRPGMTPENSRAYLAIVEVADGRTIAVHRIPPATLAGYPAFIHAPDKLAWSPDGRRILASWGQLIVVDVAAGDVQVLSEQPAPADWATSSDAVYYFGVASTAPATRGFSGFFRRKLDAPAPEQLADAPRLAALGFTRPALNYGLVSLSPRGARLALAGAMNTTTAGVLRIHAIGADGGIDLERPMAKFETGTAIALAWAPDESGVALLALPRAPMTPLKGETLEATVRIFPVADREWRTIGTAHVREVAAELDALSFWKLSWSR